MATLDDDADRIFEESYAFIARLAPSVGKRSDTGQAGQQERDGHWWLSTTRSAASPTRRAYPSASLSGDGQGVPFDEDAAWTVIVAGYGEEPPDPPGAKPFKSIEDLALLDPVTNDARRRGRTREAREGQEERTGGTVGTSEKDGTGDETGVARCGEAPRRLRLLRAGRRRSARLPGARALRGRLRLGTTRATRPPGAASAAHRGHHGQVRLARRRRWPDRAPAGRPARLGHDVVARHGRRFLGGFATLVARMKPDDEDEDDPGRGAVV